uniref:Peptidase S1 domain-containing protein n=1 Tax=Rhabditophanes sp. KR3021 TaxID=114890 RepID=A0AC35UEE5_9BILA
MHRPPNNIRSLNGLEFIIGSRSNEYSQHKNCPKGAKFERRVSKVYYHNDFRKANGNPDNDYTIIELTETVPKEHSKCINVVLAASNRVTTFGFHTKRHEGSRIGDSGGELMAESSNERGRFG